MKIRQAFFLIVLTITLTFSGSLYAQQGSYAGVESKLGIATLLLQADNAVFNDKLCVKIFDDEKNSYYAVDVSNLASEYEKIRLLELSYDNRVLVSMGSDEDVKYYFFLVNNTLNNSSEEVAAIMDGFLLQSMNEEKELSSEQLRLWLIQHDKFSK